MVHGVPVVQLVRGGGEMFGGLWMGGFARLRPGPAITIHSSPSLGPLFSYQSRRPNHANHASHNSHKKRLKKRKLEERRSTRTRQPQSTKPPTPELLPAAFTRQVWDYTSVQDHFPAARQAKRRIIGHFGPTNSGKTHNAIQALVAADSGAYCGPLRLLANEMYERMSAPDAPFSRVCSLLTGQQLIQPAGATHACCTIEMLSLNPSHDIVVIDEIQMIRDESRGWAWTRALLGSPAREVHVCGDPAAEPLVRALLKACGEELEVKRYERLSPLTIDGHSAVPNVHHLRAGDCVIAFSRKKLYTLKSEIERVGHKCCIVYGSLPPHARQEQARLFNDPKSGYDVLVATDAIGMGLNLNIGRVIFTTLSKFDGKSTAPIDAMDIRQIAGRAGRFGTQYANGQSLVLGKQRMAVELSRQFHSPVIPVEKAGIFPADDVMIAYANEAAARGMQIPFSAVIRACFENLRLDESHFFVCKRNGEDWIESAALIDDIALSLEDRITLCKCPARVGIELQKRAIVNIAEQFSEVYRGHKYSVDLPTLLHGIGVNMQDECMSTEGTPQGTSDTKEALENLEGICSVLDIYAWLGNRYECFVDLDEAQGLGLILTDQIDKGLAALSTRPTKSNSHRGRQERDRSHSQISNGHRPSKRRGYDSARSNDDRRAQDHTLVQNIDPEKMKVRSPKYDNRLGDQVYTSQNTPSRPLDRTRRYDSARSNNDRRAQDHTLNQNNEIYTSQNTTSDESTSDSTPSPESPRWAAPPLEPLDDTAPEKIGLIARIRRSHRDKMGLDL